MDLKELYDGPKTLHSHLYIQKWVKWYEEVKAPVPDEHKKEFDEFIHRALFNGTARISVELFEDRFKSRQRRAFMKFLKSCPYIKVVSPACSMEGHRRCTTYALTGLPGMVKAREELAAKGSVPAQLGVIPYWRVDMPYRRYTSVSAQWRRDKAEHWRGFCLKRGYPIAYDYIGDTHYGEATFHSCDSIVIPETVDWSSYTDSPSALKWCRWFHRRVLRGAFARVCWRKWGRLYHPLINMPKFLRRKLRVLFNGCEENVAEVDMSCTYVTILASMLRESAEKQQLTAMLSGSDPRDFYMEMNGCSEFPYATRDEVKAEFQRQCLFWIVWPHMDETLRPLWFALRRRFPDLARLINSYRSRMTGSEFSAVLTGRESSFFVDIMLPLVHLVGIPVLTIHDCLMVPQSEAAHVKDLCEREALEFFGFVPRFGVTG
jgi:hypothetical protein